MSQENTTNIILTKADGLWFEDANVVIQAGAKIFRVYRCMLTARSPVFHDILAIPASETHEMYEDCILIHMPDSEEDVTSFLSAIFDSSFFEASKKPPKIEIIVSIFRMSNKYQVSYLERRAFLHLNRLFYFQGDLHRRNFTALHQAGLLPSHDASNDEMCRIYKAHLDVIELAHSHARPWILPRAMAFFCTIPSMDPVIKSDAWIQSTTSVREYILYIRDRFGRARVGFLSAIPNAFHGEHGSDHWSGQECGQEGSNLLTYVVTTPSFLMEYAPKAQFWKHFMQRVCSHCRHRAKSHVTSAEIKFWKELPGIMGIGDWDGLKKEQQKFMEGDVN